jgi:WD40 repeat protein
MRFLQGHIGPILAVAYRPDGAELASGGWDQTVRLWDFASGDETECLKGFSAAILSLAYAADGNTLAIGTTHGLVVWDRGQGRQRAVHEQARKSLFALTFHPGSLNLALCGVADPSPGSTRPDNPLVLLDVRRDRGQRVALFGEAYGLAFDSTGQYLAAGGEHRGQGRLGVWDLNLRTDRNAVSGGPVIRCVALSPDGITLAWGNQAGAILVAPREDPAARRTLAGHRQPVLGVGFTPDGQKLISAGFDGIVKLWEVGSETEVRSFDWDISSIRAVAFAPDGMTAAAAGFDGRLVVWDLD